MWFLGVRSVLIVIEKKTQKKQKAKNPFIKKIQLLQKKKKMEFGIK